VAGAARCRTRIRLPSTRWLAARVRHLTSVEHDAAWHGRIRSRLAGHRLNGIVDYRLATMAELPQLTDGYASGAWREFDERFQDWRSIWTCSGVTETAAWFKPA
jgi:hypothetical protein